MLKIARIAIKKNAAFSDCIVVFGVKPYIVAFTTVSYLPTIVTNSSFASSKKKASYLLLAKLEFSDEKKSDSTIF